MTRGDTLKRIAAAGVTGGVLHGTGLDQAVGIGGGLPDALLRITIKAAGDMWCGGKSFGESFIQAAICDQVEATAKGVARAIGDLRGDGLDFFSHKLAHGLLGAASGAALSYKDPGRGALSGAIGAMVAESVAEVHGGDLTSLEAATFSANLGKYAAVLATGLTGLDPCIGEKTGGNAVDENFLRHAVKILQAVRKSGKVAGTAKAVKKAEKGTEKSVKAGKEVGGKVKAPARTEPTSLREELALKEAKANKGTEVKMKQGIKDPEYPPDRWAKMSYVHRGQDGENIRIHYWQDKYTGETHGFKFKDFVPPKK